MFLLCLTASDTLLGCLGLVTEHLRSEPQLLSVAPSEDLYFHGFQKELRVRIRQYVRRIICDSR